MRFVIAASCVLSVLVIGSSANSATLKELQSIDTNNNSKIDAGPEFMAYLRLIKLDVNSRESAVLARIGGMQERIARTGGIPLEEIAEKEKKPKNACAPSTKNFFIRRDKLDISIYNRELDKATAKGAAFSYLDNNLTGVQTAEVHGVASLVIARDPCVRATSNRVTSLTGYAFAVSVAADGKLNSNRVSEKSALKPALDLQLQFSGGPLIDLQVVTGSLFHQTDFRGFGDAYGYSLSWEPYQLDWRLGGTYTPLSKHLDFFWQFKAEAIGLEVNAPGLTNLTAGTNYLWAGGSVRLHFYPLWEQFDYRLSLVTTYHYYRNDRNGDNIELLTAALAYNITPDGSTSISLEYQKGTERDTLENKDQYLVSLNYKY